MGEVLFELKDGPLDGLVMEDDDWPEGHKLSGVDIWDIPTKSVYRYHAPSSVKHAVYTHRPKLSGKATIAKAEGKEQG